MYLFKFATLVALKNTVLIVLDATLCEIWLKESLKKYDFGRSKVKIQKLSIVFFQDKKAKSY